MSAILLIRHGQASFGAADYDALSATGHAQAKVLGASLKARLPQVDRVVSGGMRRHRETAAGCLEAMGLALAPVEQRGFAEYDHEEIVQRLKPAFADKATMRAELAASGDPKRAFQAIFAQAMERWMGGANDADYTESWSAFRTRCAEAFDGVAAGLGPSQTVLVFTSGGVIAALVQRALGIPDANTFAVNWTLANCGITKFIVGTRGVHLASFNEHAAFEGAHAKLITYR